MSATAGKVALVHHPDRAGLRRGLRPRRGVRDFVGYGGANDFEGSGPTPALSNTTAAVRGAAPDTDNNAADFTAGAPNPRNSGPGRGPTPTRAPRLAFTRSRARRTARRWPARRCRAFRA